MARSGAACSLEMTHSIRSAIGSFREAKDFCKQCREQKAGPEEPYFFFFLIDYAFHVLLLKNTVIILEIMKKSYFKKFTYCSFKAKVASVVVQNVDD